MTDRLMQLSIKDFHESVKDIPGMSADEIDVTIDFLRGLDQTSSLTLVNKNLPLKAYKIIGYYTDPMTKNGFLEIEELD